MKLKLASTLFFVLAATVVWPQAVPASQIGGTIHDATGAAVASAHVKSTQVVTGFVQTATSGTDGNYSLSGLPVGPYQLEVTKEGFTYYVQTGIVLEDGINLTINITLVAGPECSTEKVNGDCTVTLDRSYAVTMPTIQMRRGMKITVVMNNPLSFESLSLDPQSAQAVAGTDQTAGFLNAAMPYMKGIVISTDLDKSAPQMNTAYFSQLELSNPGFVPDTHLDTVKQDLADLDGRLRAVDDRIRDFVGSVTTVYLQLQEILSPIPRPVITVPHSKPPVAALVRAPGIPSNTPIPWADYAGWRKLLLCELAGRCPAGAPPAPISDLLGVAASFQSGLPPAPGVPAPATPDTSLFDNHGFDNLVMKTQTDIAALPAADQPQYTLTLARLVTRKADLSVYTASISTIAKDLGTYLVSIEQLQSVSAAPQNLGEIHDPRDSSPSNAAASKWLGLQVVFSVNSVNDIGTFVASVPAATQKKSIVAITVLYADPIFEVSTGAFFSTLPDRSFANQTIVTQNPGGSPTQGNVVITQSIVRPTILPFAAANFRLSHDFTWPDRRRGALYLTGAIGLNPYNTTAEFGVGPSLSWRSLMFSPLFHLGHDIELTQGEFVGEIWCNESAASGSIPKCSGQPPSPSTKKVWKGAFAFGISVRVPSVFGGGGSSAASSGGH